MTTLRTVTLTLFKNEEAEAFCNIQPHKISPVSHCFSSCLTSYYSLSQEANCSHVILAPERSQVQLGERSRQQGMGTAVTWKACTREVGRRFISLISHKILVNFTTYTLFLYLKHKKKKKKKKLGDSLKPGLLGL